ncbi:alpha-2-macroglobulin family protein [Chitinophaga sp. Hz27]|uniref:alpha-2-macroglobulin family protein n=1 Tax=Chitinophaga sp. Hz27 TaxID=3347169 RepID=UPI0035DEC61B
MKWILALLLCCYVGILTAQQPLSKAASSGHIQAVYRLTNKEALAIFKTTIVYPDELEYTSPAIRQEGFLVEDYIFNGSPQIFDEKENITAKLSPGHYIVVKTINQSQIYSYLAVPSAHITLLNNYKDLLVVVSDNNGNPVSNALVYLNDRYIPFDKNNKCFLLPKSKQPGVLQVRYKDVANFQHISAVNNYGYHHNYFDSRWEFWWNRFGRMFNPSPVFKKFTDKFKQHKHGYAQFMVISKPKYKPGDTVKLKSFITKGNGQPLNEPLQLRLSQYHSDIDTSIATIQPYRPGGYDYSFVLSDSLRLRLDQSVQIGFYKPSPKNKSRAISHQVFDYEAYELTEEQFTIRANETSLQYYRGQPIKIYLKATDRNELPVLDAHVKIIATTNSSSNYAPGITYIPGKLWESTIPLESIGETVLTLPDSIFPNANVNFNLKCILQTSSFSQLERSLIIERNTDPGMFRFKEANDSLAIYYEVAGKPIPIDGKLHLRNKINDSIVVSDMHYPCKIPISSFAKIYAASTDSVYTAHRIKQTGNNISASGGIFHDSLVISLSNPDKIPVWYQLAAGRKIIERGYGTDYARASKTKRKTVYKLMLQYIVHGEPKDKSFYFLHHSHNLNVNIDAPTVIQPGGNARITVNVTDADHKPVKDADVTSYAYTSKLRNSMPSMPEFPYYNRKSLNGRLFYKTNETDPASSTQVLNWSKWKSVLGLDTMAYYRFFHPDSILYNFEPDINGITQLAPFVVKNGVVLMPHLIWIDNQLVYISGTENSNFSFRVNEGYHKLRIRTYNRDVISDFIYTPAHKKTYVCLNIDKSRKRYYTIRQDSIFTISEKYLIDRNTFLLKTDADKRLKYITANENIYPLSFNTSTDPLLIGPFNHTQSTYVVQGSLIQDFEPEGNYIFDIREGLIKQKETDISNKYFSKILEYAWDQPKLNSFIPDRLTLDSLHNAFIETLSITTNHDDHPGTNTLLLKHPFETSIKIRQQFLYSYDDSTFIVLQGNAADRFTRLKAGYYKLMLLMQGNGYLVHDSLLVKDHQLTVYSFNNAIIQPDNDTVSRLRVRLKNSILDDNNGWTFIQQKLVKVPEPATVTKSAPATVDLSLPLIPDVNLTGVVTGVVRDNSRMPIPGVTIQIKGTRNATVTKANGEFTLRVPANGELVFAMVGFEIRTFLISAGTVYNVVLNESVTRLNDVVVVGYGTTLKGNLAGSVSAVNIQNIGTIANYRGQPGAYSDTVRIRGVASLTSANKPLLIIDGVPYDGSVENLDKDAIATINILEGEQASALYGSRAANGVIIINTNGKNPVIAKSGVAEEPVSPGSRIRQHFRDDAFWQPRLRTNEEGKATFNVTFPDDLTSWNTYALAITNHKQTGSASITTNAFRTIAASIALPHFLLRGDTLNVLTKITNYNQDSITLQRLLTIDGLERRHGAVSLVNTSIETTTATPVSTDSMRVTFQINNNHLEDGEYRTIPVQEAGTIETIGMFLALRKDTSFMVHPIDTTPVQVFASSSAMPVLLTEIERLNNYKHLCNEQAASKLIALLLQKKWYGLLDSTFTGDVQITKLVRRLEQNRNEEGLWGWWKNNETEFWITAHVMKALHMAGLQGFASQVNPDAITRFVAPELSNYASANKLYLLDALMTIDPTFKAATFLDTISIAKISATERLQLLELKQRAGINVSTEYFLRTVQHTNYGNTFWADNDPGIYGSRMSNTLAIYRMLKKEGGHEELLRSTRAWILENRGPNGWLNTWESANILETIGDDVIAEKESAAPGLQINQVAVTKFPYAQRYPAADLQIQKSGSRSIYFSATQTHFNSNPTKKDGAFRVSSSFVQDNNTLTQLTAGKEVALKVSVEAVNDGEYVLLEIPIPAGCSFAEKPQEYYWSGNESYREYLYEKVNIYCRRLRKGQHEFTIKLLPRYSGTFTLNPARAEEMYAPVMYGREGMKKVAIKEP